MTEVTAERLNVFMQKLIRDGKLIEAGFVSLRMAAMANDAPQSDHDLCRDMFFAGAQHLFSSIMTTLDPGEGPTEADIQRLQHISDELEEFIAEFMLRSVPTDGRA